ncbi:hypothetical protein [Streptomyces sp. NPDC088141]
MAGDVWVRSCSSDGAALLEVYFSGEQDLGRRVLSDEGAFEAVQKLIREQGEPSVAGSLPEAASVTRHCLVEGTVVRCLETRTQEERFHAGPLDLSGRPVFDTSIYGHSIPPPRDPSREYTLTLVQRDSVVDRSCDCGNGDVACQRCKGSGDLPCETHMPCDTCRGVDSCLRCNGTGRRTNPPTEPAERPPGPVEREADGRDICKVCGALDAACKTCRGRGRRNCTTCRGEGIRTCPDCSRAGTVPHQRCAGTGRTVTWTEGTITREPHTDDVKLPRFGVSCVAWHVARERGAWSETDLTSEKPLPDREARRLESSLRPRLAEHDGEIARHVDLKYLPVARVAVAAHPHRVYYVIPTPKAPYVLQLPSPKRVGQIAAVVCGALVVLAVVLRLFA